MSEPVTKRQPMIDLDEFEKQLRRPRSISQTDGETLAELIHLFGAQQTSRLDTGFEPQNYPSVQTSESDMRAPLINGDFAAIEAALLGADSSAARPSGGEANAETHDAAEGQTPLIKGDFSAIEAGLLGALQPNQGPMLSAPEDSSFLPVVADAEDRLHNPDDIKAPQFVEEAEVRSRRPLYVMAVIVLAGVAGIAGLVAHSNSKRGVSGEPHVATIKPEAGPVKSAFVTAPSEALSKAADAARDLARSGPAGNGATQSAAAQGALTQSATPVAAGQEKTSPRVIPLTAEATPAPSGQPMVAATSILAPPAPAGAQSLTAPVKGAAAIESKKVKTAAVRPDGSLISDDRLPHDSLPAENLHKSSPVKALTHEAAAAHAAEAAHPAEAAPAAAQREASAAKVRTSKAAAKIERLRIARHHVTKAKAANEAALEKHSRSAHQAVIVAAKPASVAAASPPAQVAEAPPAASPPVPKPSASAADGPLGIVNLAVNSITGATSKLFDWGH